MSPVSLVVDMATMTTTLVYDCHSKRCKEMVAPRSNQAKKKRSGLDRREYDYNTHIPERRSSPDRRSPKSPSDDQVKEGALVHRDTENAK